jgi:hypothetical protein
LINNHAIGTVFSPDAAGGAIYNWLYAALTLNDDTFANNAALGWNNSITGSSPGGSGRGGAIFDAATATITGTNDTFAYNLAQGGTGSDPRAGWGGAIDVYGNVALTNSTLAFNSIVQDSAFLKKGNGTDIMVETGGLLNMINSIAANGTGGLDIDVAGGYLGLQNLVMSSSGVAAKTLASTADPLLRPLANYGGPTPTLALQVGSPAIGQSSLTYLPKLDQRGYPRPNQGTGDLGAFELQHYVVTNTQDSGTGSLRWAVQSDVDESPITFSLPSGSVINLTSGPIVITHDLDIVGPGASQLTVNGDDTHRVFTVSDGTGSITGLTISRGLANQGGGIFNSGSLTLDGDVFQFDTALGDESPDLAGVGFGGAVYNDPGASLTVTNSTFANDVAEGAPGVTHFITDGRDQGDGGGARGGAIANAAGAELTVINDTFTQDIARGGDGVIWAITFPSYVGNGGAGYGGAIDNAGSATIVNATFNLNQVKQGALSTNNTSDGTDIFPEPGADLILYNTIAAGPGSFHDIVNLGTVSGGGNVVMASTGLTAGVVASTSAPQLNGLAYNGGQTPTMTLAKLSPAFGLGVLAVAPALDQLGNPRTVSGFVDPGAVELQVALPQPSAGSAYTINYGQPLFLSASNTTNPANSNLSYSWDVGGKGTFTLATGRNPRVSWSQLSALGLGVGTTTVQVRVIDGYGGVNHTIVSQPVPLTILPAFQIAAVTPSAPGSIQHPLPSVDLTFTDPVDPSTLTASGFLKLTHDRTTAILPRLTFAKVAGQPGVERLSGLCALTAEGNYVLTFDASKLSDFYGAGIGQTSVTWTIDRTAPKSHVTFLPASVTSTSFVVSATGSDPAPRSGVVVSGVASYDLYVSTNGGALAYWTTVPATNPSATFTGQGGHSYGFQSIATDAAGNREVKAAAIEAGTYVLDLTKPVTQVTYVESSNQPIGLTVNHGAAGRSFVGHVDLVFDNVTGLSDLISGNHIHLVKHALNGTGSTPISPLAYQLSVVDRAIEFNFGAKGLGGSPTSTLGDGYYEIDVDGIAQSFYFDRILGDVNGDGSVDANDVNLVTQLLGRSVTGEAIDVDGSGTITSMDRIITLRARGHALAAGLQLDA